MAIFTNTNRPTASDLKNKILNLGGRELRLNREVADLRAKMAAELATGVDGKGTRAKIAEMQAEIDSIPESVELLIGEYAEARAEEAVNALDAKHATEMKAADEIRKAADKVNKALANYREAISGPAVPSAATGIRDHRLPEGRDIDVETYLGVAESTYHRKRNDVAERARKKAIEEMRGIDPRWAPSTVKPANADGATRTHRVSIGSAPDHSSEDARRPGPQRHGMAIQRELSRMAEATG